MQTNVAEETTNLLKQLYDTTKNFETKIDNTDIDDDALPELIVKDFDEEQIWQELELQNSVRFKVLTKAIQKFSKNDLVFLNEVGGKLNENLVNNAVCDFLQSAHFYRSNSRELFGNSSYNVPKH